MADWEYHVVDLPTGSNAEEWTGVLAPLGADHWELMHLGPIATGPSQEPSASRDLTFYYYRAILRRPRGAGARPGVR